MRPPVIALIAGETSGDMLAAGLIRALKTHLPEARFVGVAGQQMREAGCEAWYDMEELAVMGIVEVLGRLPRLLRLRGQLRRRLLALKPDIFIGVDAPDFNLSLEAQLKRQGIRTLHYVSPSVWAWRQKRVFKIARATDLVLALLPFEKAFYDRFNVPCRFIGHNLADQLPLDPDKAATRAELGLDQHAPCLALLPGSRASEIDMLSAIFLQTAQRLHQQLPALQILVPMVNPARRRQFSDLKKQLAPDLPIQLFDGQSRQILTASDAALLASGTATLECMLAKCPMVVAYRLKPFTYWLAKRLVKTPYVSLPNLLANKPLVRELIQQHCTPGNLTRALTPLLTDPAARAPLYQQFRDLHQQIRRNADQQAARAVLELLP